MGPQTSGMSNATMEWDIDGYIPSIVLLSPDMRVISMDESLTGVSQISRAIADWETRH